MFRRLGPGELALYLEPPECRGFVGQIGPERIEPREAGVERPRSQEEHAQLPAVVEPGQLAHSFADARCRLEDPLRGVHVVLAADADHAVELPGHRVVPGLVERPPQLVDRAAPVPDVAGDAEPGQMARGRPRARHEPVGALLGLLSGRRGVGSLGRAPLLQAVPERDAGVGLQDLHDGSGRHAAAVVDGLGHHDSEAHVEVDDAGVGVGRGSQGSPVLS